MMANTIYDKDIRQPLCDYFEAKFGRVRFLEELLISKTRADMIMVTENGLVGIEIKSDADTYRRLARQIKDYDRYFDYNYVVVGSKHAAHVNEHVPAHWGIISVEQIKSRLDFYDIRQPQISPKAKLSNQLHLLWRRELAQIQSNNHLYKYTGKSRSFVEKYIKESIEPDSLHKQIIDILMDRDYTVFKDSFV